MKKILIASAIMIVAIAVVPVIVVAAAGDTTIVTTTNCNRDYCVETQTVYEERFDGSLVIIRTHSRTFPREKNAKPIT